MRKIFSLLIAAVLGISSAFATTVYCKMTQSWWTTDGAAIAVHHWGGATPGTTWPGVRMAAVAGEEGMWSYDLPADVTGFIFVRVNGTGAVADWGAKTGDLALPTDGKNLYTITSTSSVWGDPGVTGEWSTYAGGGDTPDFTKPYTLTFTYYDKVDGDGSAKLTTVEAIFAEASRAYVAKVDTGIHVYAGRKYKEGNDSIFSNLKLGSSSATGELKFTLAKPTQVDSIVFRAAMYSATEGGDGFKVNGENYTLSAGKLVFENKVWTPEGEVATIDLVQNKANKGRFFLTSITVYPKKAAPEPPAPAAKFYVTGDTTFLSDAGYPGLSWNPDAIKSITDTIKLAVKEGVEYKLKVTLDGSWNTVKGYSDLTTKPEGVTTDNDNNIIFKLAGDSVITIICTNDKFAVEGNFYVKPAPVLPNGFYLLGSLNNWAPDAAYRFDTTSVEGEYKLSTTLTAGDEIKPAYVEDDAARTWYGEGNYTVDAAHAGSVTIYFRPAGNGEWAAFGGYMWIEKNSGSNIDNAAAEGKAVKMIMNGMLVIEKGGKLYNVMGTLIK